MKRHRDGSAPGAFWWPGVCVVRALFHALAAATAAIERAQNLRNLNHQTPLAPALDAVNIGACLMARQSRRFNPDADHRPALRDFDPSELRGVLGHAFLTALVTDFKAKGRRLIPQLRKERRQDYLKLV